MQRKMKSDAHHCPPLGVEWRETVKSKDLTGVSCNTSKMDTIDDISGGTAFFPRGSHVGQPFTDEGPVWTRPLVAKKAPPCIFCLHFPSNFLKRQHTHLHLTLHVHKQSICSRRRCHSTLIYCVKRLTLSISQ